MDWTTDPQFQLALSRTEGIIVSAAALRHPDGIALRQRQEGHNNLQGHANSLVPLALLLAKTSPALMIVFRSLTDLAEDMGSGSSEASPSYSLHSRDS